jgi:lysophospholipase L1-like esterase
MKTCIGVWVLLLFVVFWGARGVCAEVPTTDPSRKPTLFLIGDSTVKNGQDTGTGNMWGWGHLLPAYFDASKITVENDALGGTSSRTFFEDPGLWRKVLAKVRPGDFVMMQFGHNDNTALPQSDTTRFRSTIKGNGEETVQGPMKGGGMETIHSYGWYIRQFIGQTQAKGAQPIVCSLVPRNAWTEGKVHRGDTSYGLWAKEAVEQAGGNALFLPLNRIIADHYDQMGQEKVKALFPSEREATHTDWAGATLNAACVVEGIRGLANCPLVNTLAEKPVEMKEPARAKGAAGGATENP